MFFPIKLVTNSPPVTWGTWQFGSQPGPDILQFKTVAPTEVILQPGHHQGWGWNFHNIFLSSIVDKIWRSSWIWWYDASCHGFYSRCLEIFPLKLGFFPTWMTTFNRFSLNPDFCNKMAFPKEKPRRWFLTSKKSPGGLLGTRWQVKPCRALWISSCAKKTPVTGEVTKGRGETHRFHRWQMTNLALPNFMLYRYKYNSAVGSHGLYIYIQIAMIVDCWKNVLGTQKTMWKWHAYKPKSGDGKTRFSGVGVFSTSKGWGGTFIKDTQSAGTVLFGSR